MKKIIPLIFFILTLLSFSLNTYSQCKSFAKKICKLELHPYIHDGNYNAAILTEGEDAELYKTFYSGQQYRIAVCGSESLPKIEFQVLDLDRNILFDNTKKSFTNVWDFTLDASQQLIIFVKVQNSNKTNDLEVLSGCVSIMFGILDE